jgi:hypothetical protein
LRGKITRRVLLAIGTVAIVMLTGFSLAVFLLLPSEEWSETEEGLIGIALALEDYHADHQQWPSAEEGLESLLQNPPQDRQGLRHFENHYLLPQDLHDAWGREMGYAVTRDGCVVFSFGEDGKSGGQGEAADLLLRCGEVKLQ